jgi:hypothetical protein
MANNDCKMARGLKIILGFFFGFMALGLLIVGVTYLPVIGIFLAAIALVIAFLFLFAPRDPSCYLTR